MKIAIDGRLWSESGLGRYIRNLINGLQNIDSVDEYFVLLLRKDHDIVVFHNKKFHKVLADIKWYGVEEQIKLPKLLNEIKPDLVHFPHFNVSIFYKGKFIVTIHDLIHQHFSTRETTTHNPITHTVKKFGYKKIFSYAVKKSEKIITPSEFVKKQLREEWGIEKRKITVTYEGVEENIINLARKVDAGDFDDLAAKYNFNKPYLYYVGNAQPHKNLPRLINVFGELKEEYPDLSLVLSGPDHLFWEKIKKESHIGGMIFTGFISDKEMVVLYKNAVSFIMPSLEEGFGIPLLEAMASECPVISSDKGSLPEVGGNAAIYFDPNNEEDMAQKICRILNDLKLRKDLIDKGNKRYKEFSWQRTAKQTLEIYTNV